MTLVFFGKNRGKSGDDSKTGPNVETGIKPDSAPTRALETQQVKFAAIQEVRAYWEALRKDGTSLPHRDQIDPRGLAKSLENVFLIERIARGQARFRLAGMHLFDLMGMEVRGMPISALFEPLARDRVSDALEAVFAGPSVLDLWLEAERGMGRPPLEGRLTLLPLATGAGEPSLALGCLATHGSLGRRPRRFAVSGLVREPIRTAVLPQPNELIAGFAESAANFAPRPPRGKPMLRLMTFDN